ncbi:MFS transporter [Gordonia sp. (in: high G+C Gram-positive bacteria)]|uniref:MFS transporter n=1 Tax=Gordonia sp. (in: high G+C Gram-positive bacteria) TaxID=84139 RepID=UPI001694E443|nr:MFS transporter [Gordonia sp. (in: high G+C Gram-positive bacteria)]NLG46844.1 MFS transporter [Gordonia sp. (in: high G+C Gram-positive bacteria)]
MSRRILADTRPLQNVYFRRLWTANIITVIGAQLTIVAVPAQLYAITGSSAYVGLSGVFGLVPLVVFGLWGGALADTFDRRRILIVTTLGLILTSVAFWLQAAAGANNVWLLLSIFAVQQAFFAVNQPTRTAVLPRILPLERLPAANSLNMTVMQAGAIAGPLVGGALIPFLGFSTLYLVDSIFLFATLWAVVTLPPLPPEHNAADGAKPTAGFRSVIDGLVYLKGHPVLLMSFVVDLIAMIFGMPRALFPQMAHESFGGPTDGGLAFAILFIAIPLGAVVGGVLSGWVSRVERQGRAVIICIVIWGASIAVSGGVLVFANGSMLPILPIVVVALMVGGAADMASAAFRQTMLQSAASDDVRGRLQGVFIVVVAGGPRIADVTHGATAAVAGTAVTVAGGGILVVILTVIAAFAVPVFWRYRVAASDR